MTSPTPQRHIPVMLDRVVALLAPALESDDSVLVDATLGLGGHAETFLTAFPNLRLVGIDRDSQALELSTARLATFAERITLVHAVYDELPEVLAGLGIDHVQGILFDLGVSSMQLDDAERGFAYAQDAPLDMRMDSTTGRTAAEIVNTYSASELARILRQYGEERYAKRIANFIVREREFAPLTSSAQLVSIVREAIPAPARRTGGNPAKRTFQALRIEVNGELDVLVRAVPAALDALAVHGRAVVMSYQSLEDAIVKRAFSAVTRVDVPAGLPVIPESAKPKFELVTRGSEKADEEEVAKNPRAASVRIRAIERVAA
mgnify:CR=1 FL=1